VIGRIKANQISYEPDVVRNIEYAGVRGDVVVIMGEEVVQPNKDAPYAGKPSIDDSPTYGNRSTVPGSCGFAKRP
jgi:hypothetical protein